MRILVIDDDPDTCHLVDVVLGAEGHEVRSATSGEEGLQFLGRAHPDLVILDVMLPHLYGWEVCRHIRTFSDIPVVMISAFARTADDMVHGLECGADDYLPKPLDFNLLRAKVRVLLRRNAQGERRGEHPAYVDAHLTVDLQHQQVYVQGNPVHLSPLEWQLLEILVRNINQAVPAIEIVEELWPGADVDARVSHVYVYVERLRRVIEPDPQNPRYVVTEHGLGYRFQRLL